MPRPAETSITEEPVKKNDYIELRLPKLPVSVGNGLLILLLVGTAFFAGFQTGKLNTLESNTISPGTANAGLPEASPTPSFYDVDEGHLPILGNKDAKVTLVEFSDYQCPFCKRYTDDALAQIKKEYVDTGKVKIAFRHYPLSFHANAPKAAEASECANEQNAFWAYHDVLFDKQDNWSPQALADAQTSFVTYAGELGLDTTQFESCLTSGKYAENVARDTKAAVEAGANATPTVYVNGQQIVGAVPFEEFKKVIEEQLAK